jgi:hypothetical protein
MIAKYALGFPPVYATPPCKDSTTANKFASSTPKANSPSVDSPLKRYNEDTLIPLTDNEIEQLAVTETN